MVIQTEEPDIVAVTGDVVSGYAWDYLTYPWYSVQYNNFLRAFKETN